MKEFSDIKRIVVKIGSSSLTHSGGGINFRKIDRIAMAVSYTHLTLPTIRLV